MNELSLAKTMWVRETSRIAHGAAPIILFYLAEVAMGIVDTMVAGRLSVSALAAVGVASGLLFAMLYAAMGVTSSATVFMVGSATDSSQAWRAPVKLGLLSAAVLSPVVMAAGLAVPTLLHHLGQREEVVSLCRPYLYGAIFSVPSALVFNVYRGLLSVFGAGRRLVAASTAGIALNAIASPLLALGWGDGRGLGVFGIGVATALSNLVMLGLATFFAFRQTQLVRRADSSRLRHELVFDFMRIGWPAFVLGLFESGLFAAVLVLAGGIDQWGLAASTIGVQLADVGAAFGLGIGEATTISVAAHQHQGNTRITRHTIVAGVVVVSVVMSGFGYLTIANLDLTQSVFLGTPSSGSAQVTAALAQVLPIIAVVLVADGVQLVLFRALKGLKDAAVPMIIAMMGYWVVGIGGGYVLGTVASLGVRGIWLGFATGLVVTGIGLAVRACYRL